MPAHTLLHYWCFFVNWLFDCMASYYYEIRKSCNSGWLLQLGAIFWDSSVKECTCSYYNCWPIHWQPLLVNPCWLNPGMGPCQSIIWYLRKKCKWIKVSSVINLFLFNMLGLIRFYNRNKAMKTSQKQTKFYKLFVQKFYISCETVECC